MTTINKGNTPHETTAPQQAATHHEPTKPAAAEAAPPDAKVLMEGPGGIKVSRFKLNGIIKSLNLPVSGAELHRISGGATKLTVGGKEIANNAEPLDLADDAEVTATY